MDLTKSVYISGMCMCVRVLNPETRDEKHNKVKIKKRHQLAFCIILDGDKKEAYLQLHRSCTKKR